MILSLSTHIFPSLEPGLSFTIMYPRSLVNKEKNPLGITVIVLDSFFLALAAVALAVRVSSRRIQGHQLCLNDYTALLAWVL